MSEIIDMGVQLDIISKSGSWFYYNEERIAQGRDRVREYLEQNPALAAEIEEKIKAADVQSVLLPQTKKKKSKLEENLCAAARYLGSEQLFCYCPCRTRGRGHD